MGTDPSVAVVTGAASGIGAATVRRLTHDGFRVVACDVQAEAGSAVAEASGATYAQLDVSDAAAWADLAAGLERAGAPVSRAVLNAGILTSVDPIAFLEIAPERYERVRAVNLDGVVFGISALAPLMTRGEGGAIVATASLAGLGPY